MADTERPLIVGADAGPEAPFPLRMEGKVISGFGRGSKEVSKVTSLYSAQAVPALQAHTYQQ